MNVRMRSQHFPWLLAGVALGLGACKGPRPLAAPAASLTPPSRLCAVGEKPPQCRSARQVEDLMGGRLEILGMAPTPSGQQDARILTLRARLGARDVVFRAKWRAQSTGGIVNEPRKELAAHAVQKLFLDETELASPPTVPHCFPLDEYRVFVPDERASFDGIDCVLGFLSYWLEAVRTARVARQEGLLGGAGEGFWDAERFEKDAMYRRSAANTNLMTYVIRHGDPHNAQFLREDWSQIRVPRLPKRTVERLRALDDEDFAGLTTVTELERRGRQLAVMAKAAPVDSDEAAMSWHGSRLRIGLSRDEIALVQARVRDLLARPDLARMIEP